MEFRKFEKPVTYTVEYEGTQYYFAGYLMPSENLIIRVRPVTNWIRENALISSEGAVYVPRYEETTQKGE